MASGFWDTVEQLQISLEQAPFRLQDPAVVTPPPGSEGGPNTPGSGEEELQQAEGHPPQAPFHAPVAAGSPVVDPGSGSIDQPDTPLGKVGHHPPLHFSNLPLARRGKAKQRLDAGFADEVKRQCRGRFIHFDPADFESWSTNLFWIYRSKKSKQGSELFVQGYRHRHSGKDVVVVYEDRGVKRLGQRVKAALNFVNSSEPRIGHRDRDLLFGPVRITSPKTLQEPHLKPIQGFVAELPFSQNPNLYKAQGEHLSKVFKILVADFPSEEIRRDFFEGMFPS